MEKENKETEWWWATLLKTCDPVKDWPVETRLERLRKNVMKAISAPQEKANGSKDNYRAPDADTKSLSV